MRNSSQVRQEFIEYFTQRVGHVFVPSSPLVPHDDPTLLFANAGMNQFKPIFLGLEQPKWKRVANSQKCIRAGGKHNDLDDVGKDTYHHTFFEMLGNWSFGDYFKTEAIGWAWELLTKVWGLDPTRLHATVFRGDEKEGLAPDQEAFDLWAKLTDIPKDHIHWGSKKDNFWEMADTGPCGPCSEIHVDLTPDKSGGHLVNKGDARVMEIWNLVFIQFNRLPGGKLEPLPARHVDTGMGFERLCAVMQGKGSNYDSDVFAPLMNAIGDLSKSRYQGQLADATDTAFRVIADHARMSTFAITDGAVPSNKKRGAVLRSVIRRATRYGYQVLKLREPFLYKLVPVIADQMGKAFPELLVNPAQTARVIESEEREFLATVERGLKVFEAAAQGASGGLISAQSAFDLHATYGFPADLTRQIAEERKLGVDMAGYDKLWEEHVKVSGQGRKQHLQVAVDLSSFGATDDSPKYAVPAKAEARIAGWIAGDKPVTQGRAGEDEAIGLILDKTCFYAEQGGQAADTGRIRSASGVFEVTSTQRKGAVVIHLGQVVEGSLEVGQDVLAEVDASRLDTMRNHTATHLINWALRGVLGDHVEQKGSLVEAGRLRFDFSHPSQVTPEQIRQVEDRVNARVRDDEAVTAQERPLKEALSVRGIRAVFGEKYPDPVRVVAIGGDAVTGSAEFCGGTHIDRTGRIGLVRIVSESSAAKGIRRIEAVTGGAAMEYSRRFEAAAVEASRQLSCPVDQLAQRVGAMQEELRDAKKKGPSGAAFDAGKLADALLASAKALPAGKLIVAKVEAGDDEQLRSLMDSLKSRPGELAALVASAVGGKVSLASCVSKGFVAAGLKAGDWVKAAATVAGGGGGGRPDFAQAGAKDPSKLDEALEAARAFAAGKLG